MKARRCVCSEHLRSGRADVGELPLQILVQLLETFKGDLELVRRREGGRVVAHSNVEQRHGGHVGGCDAMRWEWKRCSGFDSWRKDALDVDVMEVRRCV